MVSSEIILPSSRCNNWTASGSPWNWPDSPGLSSKTSERHSQTTWTAWEKLRQTEFLQRALSRLLPSAGCAVCSWLPDFVSCHSSWGWLWVTLSSSVTIHLSPSKQPLAHPHVNHPSRLICWPSWTALVLILWSAIGSLYGMRGQVSCLLKNSAPQRPHEEWALTEMYSTNNLPSSIHINENNQTLALILKDWYQYLILMSARK